MAAVPPLPKSFDRQDLEACGFAGWRTWDQLRANDFRPVAGRPAVYVVYRASSAAPSCLESSRGGHFKGKDPSVAIETLRTSWVPGCSAIYIGKADVADRRLK